MHCGHSPVCFCWVSHSTLTTGSLLSAIDNKVQPVRLDMLINVYISIAQWQTLTHFENNVTPSMYPLCQTWNRWRSCYNITALLRSICYPAWILHKHLRLAACTTSLTSLMSRLICWLVRSNSFSCLCRFSRNWGLSARHSVNSSGCRPTPIVTHSRTSFAGSRSQHHALSPNAVRPQHRE